MIDAATDIDFTIQARIWGYVITGDVLQAAAIIAEGRNVIIPGAWDRTAADIAGSLMAHGDEPFRPVPQWWALACAPQLATAGR